MRPPAPYFQAWRIFPPVKPGYGPLRQAFERFFSSDARGLKNKSLCKRLAKPFLSLHGRHQTKTAQTFGALCQTFWRDTPERENGRRNETQKTARKGGCAQVTPSRRRAKKPAGDRGQKKLHGGRDWIRTSERQSRTDLQSAPFSHLDTLPSCKLGIEHTLRNFRHKLFFQFFWEYRPPQTAPKAGRPQAQNPARKARRPLTRRKTSRASSKHPRSPPGLSGGRARAPECRDCPIFFPTTPPSGAFRRRNPRGRRSFLCGL